MYRHLWILPDGTEVFSGAEQENVLRSVKVTQSVNSGMELTLGSACSAMMEAELITPGGRLVHFPGDESLVGQFVRVTIDRAEPFALRGTMTPGAPENS